MTFVETDNKTVRDAFERITALRRLTADTGVKTYKSQSAILESLDPQTLAAVAMLLNPPKKENSNANDYQPLTK
jgi:uncharacterized protein with GYD domain